MPRVLLAMSGGVDSSVAAVLLREQGHEVIGCFMRLGSPGESLDNLERADDACRVQSPAAAPAAPVAPAAPAAPTAPARVPLKIAHQGCCSINDAADARLVAAHLGIPFYVVNFKRDFGRIMDYFVAEYDAGRTPNPCVRCNDWLKFGKLHDYAHELGADFVASGHYAQVVRGPCGEIALCRGVDLAKDQSYVLFGTPRDRLARMLLPIGGMHKPAVRALAQARGLPVFDKPDSQEICFVPDNDYAGFVERRSSSGLQPGPVLDLAGTVIGEHGGHQRFTIGQRRGVRIAKGEPVYVVAKDAAANTITVGPREALLAAGCVAAECNWLEDPHSEWRACEAKVRYNAAPVPARARSVGGRLEVLFAEPQAAVAPGQAVVCFDGPRVVCGGWIERAISPPAGPPVPRDPA